MEEKLQRDFKTEIDAFSYTSLFKSIGFISMILGTGLIWVLWNGVEIVYLGYAGTVTHKIEEIHTETALKVVPLVSRWRLIVYCIVKSVNNVEPPQNLMVSVKRMIFEEVSDVSGLNGNTINGAFLSASSIFLCVAPQFGDVVDCLRSFAKVFNNDSFILAESLLATSELVHHFRLQVIIKSFLLNQLRYAQVAVQFQIARVFEPANGCFLVSLKCWRDARCIFHAASWEIGNLINDCISRGRLHSEICNVDGSLKHLCYVMIG